MRARKRSRGIHGPAVFCADLKGRLHPAPAALTAANSVGTTSLKLSPTELIEKLASLVPPPRLNLIRYHGVLAPAAPDRAQIVPGPQICLNLPERNPKAR